MSQKRRILIQLDNDPRPSVFDRVVAVDAGADEVFSYGGIEPEHAESLVHGAIFTRGARDLKSTAIFVGGRNVVRAEEVFAAVQRSFFGPLRCSILLDPNGANTTAAAAVLSARRHLNFAETRALVLGGTGPVGQRVALLLARQHAEVWISSRSQDRALDTCKRIADTVDGARLHSVTEAQIEALSKDDNPPHLIISAAAAGVRTIHRSQIQSNKELRVVMDLNAVPPLGVEGVQVTDNGRQEGGVLYFGAIGVGGLKMKIHKAAVARLFDTNDHVLDAVEIYDIGSELEFA